jgi:hypothetical protein
VGYFEPDLDSDGDMVTVGKDLWFRDVFLFTDRLKDIAITKDVRTNRTAFLRGTALTWYQSEWDGYDTAKDSANTKVAATQRILQSSIPTQTSHHQQDPKSVDIHPGACKSL